LLFAAASATAGPVRLRPEDPPTEQEIDAADRFADRGCRPPLAAFYPGLGHLSCGKREEGRALVALGTLELAGAAAGSIARGPGSSAAQLPLLAFSDLLVASTFDLVVDSQRAERLVFTPSESLTDLFAAPFDPRVLGDPLVFGGILGTLAAGIAVLRIVDGPISTQGFGQEPVIFGTQMHDSVGYPLAGALGTALFVQVAAAEEVAFRGVLQSGLSRNYGETAGWAWASLAFGLVHASNLPFVDRDKRLQYLYAGVPFITVLGSYLGLAYRYGGYRLAKPVAVHFWYDFLLEAIAFAGDPKHSPLSASIGLRF
jgi:membrane protease YdiL (CAAX protease family)